MKSITEVSSVYDLPYVADDNVYLHVDLRIHPTEIDAIPELAGRPVLRELVSVLNSKDGPFMTHGSAFALTRPYGSGGTIPLSQESISARHWCTSYVTFSYWQMSLNEEQNFAALYESFTAEANGTEVCFVIQPAYFLTRYERQCGAKWSETNGTVCLVWVSGWGASEVIAHSRWRNTIMSLSAFFRGVAMSDSNGSGMTVSQHMLNESQMPPS